jgi:transglutaminase-like putative cysteine protease
MTTPVWNPGPALLGLLAGWLALCSWAGMVEQPRRFLVPVLLIGLLMVLVGSGLRLLRVPPYVVVAGQVAVGLGALNASLAAEQSFYAVVPTRASLGEVAYVIGNGAATLNHYAAPVEVNPVHTGALLTACGLAVVLAVDVLAITLRRPPLAGLPLLVTLSVPVSILAEPLALPVFVGVAVLFLRLLGTEHLERLRAWRHTKKRATAQPLTQLWTVAVVAVLATLVVAPLVPVTDLLDREGDGPGDGAGASGYQLTVINPFIRLRRDLVAQTHTPLIYARTEARDTSYIRTTVLDEFTDDEWRPSPRHLPGDNRADGVFPNPPGLAPGVGGSEDEWRFELAPGFGTTWLPLPYPIRELDIRGTWRYDSRTLDVAYVGGGAARELSYKAKSFTPAITAELLNSTISAPAKIRRPMTRVPDELPEVIRTRAREVTRGADSSFAKAVALQDWFRQEGGFRYSLEQRDGSGMDLLASFVTDDRVGYCEQFAAAMAAMGRTLGIPSRVVVGFLDGAVQPNGRTLYTSDDRHAWPEMYFSGVGWVRFEPTPGQRAGATPPWTRQDPNPAQPEAQPTDTPSSQAVPLPDREQADATPGDGGVTDVVWWPVAALVVVLLLALAPWLARQVQRRRRLGGSDPVHLAEGAWAELRATALDLGLDWPERRSPREQARRVTEQVQADEEHVESLENLLVRVERGRYAADSGAGRDVETLEPEGRSGTVHTVHAWRRVMTESLAKRPNSAHRLWRGRLWPVSLVRGRRR